MPVIDVSLDLKTLIADCNRCFMEFYSNVALIADDEGCLTLEQLRACVKHLAAEHVKHVH